FRRSPQSCRAAVCAPAIVSLSEFDRLAETADWTRMRSTMAESGVEHELSLLGTLEEISRLVVSHTGDPRETLTNIARLIQPPFRSAVCSVSLRVPDRRPLVLSATMGLEPASVGRVRMRMDEGLVGLVAEQLAPHVVADATRHPRFKYFPEAGEDLYHSFLGVP